MPSADTWLAFALKPRGTGLQLQVIPTLLANKQERFAVHAQVIADRRRLIPAAVLLLSLTGCHVPDPLQRLVAWSTTSDVRVARREVFASLVDSWPSLVAGQALATLAPEITGSPAVDIDVSHGWTTALVAVIRERRPDLEVTDRTSLETVLREQRFADSGYADSQGAAQVGKIVTANTLLMTRVHRFQRHEAGARVSLEMQLIDVETGLMVWSDSIDGIILAPRLRGLVASALAVVVILLLRWIERRVGQRRCRRLLVKQRNLRARVDGLLRSAIGARARLINATDSAAAAALDRALQDLDSSLEPVRGIWGTRSPSAAKAELGRSRRLTAVVARLTRTCETLPPPTRSAGFLVGALRQGAAEIRGLVKQPALL